MPHGLASDREDRLRTADDLLPDLLTEVQEQFEGEQIGSGEDMARAAVSEAAGECFDLVDVQCQGIAGAELVGGELTGEAGDVVVEVTRAHHDVGPQQFLVVPLEGLGNISPGRGQASQHASLVGQQRRGLVAILPVAALAGR